jgi:CDP-diacylglycerol pyrophosphatase
MDVHGAMDVLMLSTAIAALAVAILALACAISVYTLVLRKPDSNKCPIVPDECVVTMGPEPEPEPYSDAESREGSFTLPLPPGFGMSTAQLC